MTKPLVLFLFHTFAGLEKTRQLKRILNACLLLTFLAGYLEWGGGNQVFIFQAEAELLVKAISHPKEVLHPFILIPFLGQLLLLYSLFQPKPGRVLTLTGLACLSTIMLFLFVIGIISPNLKILGSVIPFLIVGVVVLRSNWKQKEKV